MSSVTDWESPLTSVNGYVPLFTGSTLMAVSKSGRMSLQLGLSGTGVGTQAAALKASPLAMLQAKNATRAAAVTNAPISTVRDNCVDMNRSLLPIRTSRALANQKAAAFSEEDSG